MKISEISVFKKNQDVIERLGEEVLLFDANTGKLFELNETGRVIWLMFDGKHTIKEIKEQIEKEFEDINTIEKDLQIFLNSLLELKLIKKVK